MILCVETSQAMCSVALFNEGKLLGTKESNEPNSHNRIITLLIDELMKECSVTLQQLQAAALSSGPGSYTGLRVGSSALKGLCFGLKIQLIAIPTLKLIAYQASLTQKADLYISMIDARRMEVFEQSFNEELTEMGHSRAIILDETYVPALDPTKTYCFCGNGASKLLKLNSMTDNKIIMSDILPMARFMGIFATEKFTNQQFENLAYFEPFYLKAFGEKAINDI